MQYLQSASPITPILSLTASHGTNSQARKESLKVETEPKEEYPPREGRIWPMDELIHHL